MRMHGTATSDVKAITPDRRSIDAAFDECEKFTKSRVENFSIGTLLIPRRLRRHFYSIYAFCRGVDDIGDDAIGDRNALLNDWENELELCYSGTPRRASFLALQNTIQTFNIKREPFECLIEANRRDQVINRYPDFETLLDYCRYSANPVGHIVLCLWQVKDPAARELSDATCTALQLANFWQDVARDYQIGRIYLPQDEMREFGVSESDIANGNASDNFRSLMQYQVDRTRQLFAKGIGLSELLPQRLAMEVAMFNAAGLAVLRAIEDQKMDTLSARPVVSRAKKARIILRIAVRSALGLSILPSADSPRHAGR